MRFERSERGGLVTTQGISLHDHLWQPATLLRWYYTTRGERNMPPVRLGDLKREHDALGKRIAAAQKQIDAADDKFMRLAWHRALSKLIAESEEVLWDAGSRLAKARR